MPYVPPSPVANGQEYTAAAHNIIVDDIIDHETRINAIPAPRYTIATSTTRPASPVTGQLIYETDTQDLVLWNGSGWQYYYAPLPGDYNWANRSALGGVVPNLAGGPTVANDASGNVYILTNSTSGAGYIVKVLPSGVRDLTFRNTVQLDSAVYACNPLSNGDLILAGSFTRYQGNSCNRVIRISSSGVRDTTFDTNLGTGPNTTVYASAMNTSGQILLGGFFTSWNGVANPQRVRLINSDGTSVSSFNTNMGSGPNSDVTSIAFDATLNKWYLAGWFTSWNGVGSRNYLIRLNSDGTVDSSWQANFGSGLNSGAYQVIIDSSGRPVFVGAFTTVNGATCGTIGRLTTSGFNDTTFSNNIGFTGPQGYSVAELPSGRYFLTMNTNTFKYRSHNGYVIINSDGTPNYGYADSVLGPGSGSQQGGYIHKNTYDNSLIWYHGGSTWNGVANSWLKFNLS